MRRILFRFRSASRSKSGTLKSGQIQLTSRIHHIWCNGQNMMQGIHFRFWSASHFRFWSASHFGFLCCTSQISADLQIQQTCRIHQICCKGFILDCKAKALPISDFCVPLFRLELFCESICLHIHRIWCKGQNKIRSPSLHQTKYQKAKWILEKCNDGQLKKIATVALCKCVFARFITRIASQGRL